MLHSRLDRVCELLKAELADIIDKHVTDPKIPPMVTVHSVKVSRDLRSAQVYVTFLNDDDQATVDGAVGALNHAAGFIRGELGRRVELRYLPALHFHYNPSTRYAAGLEEVFHKIDRGEDPEDPASKQKPRKR